MELNKYIIESDIKLDNRIIKEPTFVPRPPENLNLQDKVAVYNDGHNWKVIQVDLLMRYLIIYDKHYDKNIVSDMSITFCPFTFTAIIYFDKYTPTNKIYNGNIMIKDKDNILVSQMKGSKFVRKKEIKLMTLRNVISNYPDCSYFDMNINNILDKVVDDSYLNNKKLLYPIKNKDNKFHPKTLVYGIEYKSKDIKAEDYKYTVVVGKEVNNNKEETNSFDFVKNGYVEYFDSVIDRIRDKGGIIIPCFWFGWVGMHGDVKVVKL